MKKELTIRIMQKATQAARKICRPGCIGAYKSCTRCRQPNNNGFVMTKVMTKLPMLGTDTICPLAKYKVEEQGVPKDFFEALKNAITEGDCMYLCANCQYGEVIVDGAEWYVTRTETAFEQHCLDCPVQMEMDGINENRAEAAMS